MKVSFYLHFSLATRFISSSFSCFSLLMYVNAVDQQSSRVLLNGYRMTNTDFACARVLDPTHLLNPSILTAKF